MQQVAKSFFSALVVHLSNEPYRLLLFVHRKCATSKNLSHLLASFRRHVRHERSPAYGQYEAICIRISILAIAFRRPATMLPTVTHCIVSWQPLAKAINAPASRRVFSSTSAGSKLPLVDKLLQIHLRQVTRGRSWVAFSLFIRHVIFSRCRRKKMSLDPLSKHCCDGLSKYFLPNICFSVLHIWLICKTNKTPSAKSWGIILVGLWWPKQLN